MLPGSTLLLANAVSMSSKVMPEVSIRFRSGMICNCLPTNPVTSTIATSGNCSIRRLMTVSANWHKSRNASSSSTFPASFSVRFKQKTGISVALALTTRGRSISRDKWLMAASIFSFTSIKAKSVLVPNSKLKRTTPFPSRVSLWISFKPATCINCWRIGLTIVFSSSRADVF